MVNHGLRDVPQNVRVMAEPGRYLVSDAGYFVCRVVGTATRSGKRWMYWDAGVFGGVIETTEGLRYDILTDRQDKLIPWMLLGPRATRWTYFMRDGCFRRHEAGISSISPTPRLHPRLREQFQGWFPSVLTWRVI